MSAAPDRAAPPLNTRAKETFAILAAHQGVYGKLPPQYKIALWLGLSPGSTDIVRAAYMALEGAGLIKRLSPGWRWIKLVEPKEDYTPNLPRPVHAALQYEKGMQLVEGLQVAPEDSLVPKLRGLKPLSTYTKGYWLLGFPARPERSAAK